MDNTVSMESIIMAITPLHLNPLLCSPVWLAILATPPDSYFRLRTSGPCWNEWRESHNVNFKNCIYGGQVWSRQLKSLTTLPRNKAFFFFKRCLLLIHCFPHQHLLWLNPDGVFSPLLAILCVSMTSSTSTLIRSPPAATPNCLELL